MLMLCVGVGCVRAGDVAGLIAIPKLSLPASAPLSPSLTAEQVHSTVRAHQGALQRCYDVWLARHPLRSNVIFAAEIVLAVAPDGSSEQLSIRGLDQQAPLATCIEGELSAWRFPRSQLGADVHVPLVLAGREGSREDGAPSPRDLHQTVLAQRPSLGPCFEGVEGTPPALHVSLSVDPQGNPRSAQLRGAEREPRLRSCLRDALLAWRFPRAEKATELAFPL